MSAAREGMPAIVPNGGTSFHFPGGASAGVRTKPPSEDEYMGVTWGISPKAAHTRKIHACRWAADVVNYRRASRDIEGACAYAVPMEHALAGLTCTTDAKYREAVTDAEEDRLQAEADKNPCEQTVRALERYRAVMRQASIDDSRRRYAEVGIEL